MSPQVLFWMETRLSSSTGPQELNEVENSRHQWPPRKTCSSWNHITFEARDLLLEGHDRVRRLDIDGESATTEGLDKQLEGHLNKTHRQSNEHVVSETKKTSNSMG